MVKELESLLLEGASRTQQLFMATVKGYEKNPRFTNKFKANRLPKNYKRKPGQIGEEHLFY